MAAPSFRAGALWPIPAMFRISNHGRVVHYKKRIDIVRNGKSESLFGLSCIEDLVAAVRWRRATPHVAPVACVLTLFVTIPAWFLTPVFVSLPLLALTLLVCMALWLIDEKKRLVFANFDIDDEIALRFSRVRRSFTALIQATNVWLVHSRSALHFPDTRYPRRSSVTGDSLIVEWKPKPPLQTNVETPRIGNRELWLTFFPDLIWIERIDGSVKTAAYESVLLDCNRVQLYEHTPPADARVVGVGRTEPVVEYAEIVMEIADEPVLHVLVSNINAAQEFVQAFNRKRKPKKQSFASGHVSTEGIKFQGDAPATWPIRDGDPPHVILGVSIDSPPARIKAAHLRLARIYHPDVWADKSPEGLKQAHDTMKLINNARDAMMQRLSRQ